MDENHGSNARRLAQGVDQNRLSMLLAVMHKHGGIALHNEDVFINVVGGVKYILNNRIEGNTNIIF